MEDHIITIYGIFADNELVDIITGEITPCVTYGILRDEIQDKTAFYNLKLHDKGYYVIFQYVDITV